MGEVMIKWEYFNSPAHITPRQANDLGAKGWELCGITTGECMWFKRPIGEVKPERCESKVNATPDLDSERIVQCTRESSHEGSHCQLGFSWETDQQLKEDPAIGGTQS